MSLETDDKNYDILCNEIMSALARADFRKVPIAFRIAAIGGSLTQMITRNYPRSEWRAIVEAFNETSTMMCHLAERDMDK